MKVLFDTNIILDVLLERLPFAPLATNLIARVEKNELVGLVGATTITTIYYIVAKAIDKQKATKAIHGLLQIFSVAPVDQTVLKLAMNTSFTDFEDAVLHEAARLAGANAIVTRNINDFKYGSLIIYTPAELESILQALYNR